MRVLIVILVAIAIPGMLAADSCPTGTKKFPEEKKYGKCSDIPPTRQDCFGNNYTCNNAFLSGDGQMARCAEGYQLMGWNKEGGDPVIINQLICDESNRWTHRFSLNPVVEQYTCVEKKNSTCAPFPELKCTSANCKKPDFMTGGLVATCPESYHFIRENGNAGVEYVVFNHLDSSWHTSLTEKASNMTCMKHEGCGPVKTTTKCIDGWKCDKNQLATRGNGSEAYCPPGWHLLGFTTTQSIWVSQVVCEDNKWTHKYSCNHYIREYTCINADPVCEPIPSLSCPPRKRCVPPTIVLEGKAAECPPGSQFITEKEVTTPYHKHPIPYLICQTHKHWIMNPYDLVPNTTCQYVCPRPIVEEDGDCPTGYSCSKDMLRETGSALACRENYKILLTYYIFPVDETSAKMNATDRLVNRLNCVKNGEKYEWEATTRQIKNGTSFKFTCAEIRK